MNWGYVLTVGIAFTVLLLMLQRIPEGKRRGFRYFVIFVALLLLIRGNLIAENFLGYGIGITISFLFWLLIGRYNPPNHDREIKVYGLDD